jgi:hypothetical protein
MKLNQPMTKKWNALKALAAAVVVGLPVATASAQQLSG